MGSRIVIVKGPRSSSFSDEVSASDQSNECNHYKNNSGAQAQINPLLAFALRFREIYLQNKEHR
jgi:hypothetical protein